MVNLGISGEGFRVFDHGWTEHARYEEEDVCSRELEYVGSLRCLASRRIGS